MGKMGSFSASDLKKLQKQLGKIPAAKRDVFVEECAKELAARLLAKVKKRTPVGDYSKEIEVTAKRDSKHHKKGDVYKKRVNPDGKVGGTLKRGWTIGEIRKEGDFYKIDIINNTGYSSYIEFGHRTAGHKGWVKGYFMLTISEQEIREIAPRVLESKIRKYLTECMK